MSANRIRVLEHVAQGNLTVDEAVTLLKVLAAIEALDLQLLNLCPSISIDLYLN